jgi:hypothetical protein
VCSSCAAPVAGGGEKDAHTAAVLDAFSKKKEEKTQDFMVPNAKGSQGGAGEAVDAGHVRHLFALFAQQLDVQLVLPTA